MTNQKSQNCDRYSNKHKILTVSQKALGSEESVILRSEVVSEISALVVYGVVEGGGILSEPI